MKNRDNQRTKSTSSTNHWLAENRRCLNTSLTQLKQSALISFLSIAVIGISLSLAAGLSLLLSNVEQISGQMHSSNTLSLYLHLDADEQQINTLREELVSRGKIANIEYISRELALEEFKRNNPEAELIALLGENPLPAVISVEPHADLEANAIKRLAQELETIDSVESVHFNSEWLVQTHSLIDLLQTLSAVLSFLLTASVVLIIANTIRASIQSRFNEIQLSRLFGATKAYIRRPFLYSGLLYGFFGGLLASFLLLVGYVILADPIQRLLGLFQTTDTSSSLMSPFLFYFLIITLLGAVLGTISAYIVVFIQLQRLESNEFS